MRRSHSPFVLVLLASLSTCAARGQSAPELPAEQAALFDRIRAASYHPGKIGLSCEGSLDFTALLAKMGGATNTDGAKALEGLRLHLTTGATGPTSVTFTWPGGKFPAEVKAQLEVGARQMLEGFSQAYWSMANADVLPVAKDQPTVAGTLDGGFAITTQGSAKRLTISRDVLIQQMEARDAQGQITVTRASYAAAADAKPGDLVRLSGLDVDQGSGATRVHEVITWDSQDVGGAHVPHRINVSLPGLFDVAATLSNCSIAWGTVTPAK
jgi:hypothetical protein